MGHCPAAFASLGERRGSPLISYRRKETMGGPERHPTFSVTHFPFSLESLGLFHAFILVSLSVSLTSTGFRLIYPSIFSILAWTSFFP